MLPTATYATLDSLRHLPPVEESPFASPVAMPILERMLTRVMSLAPAVPKYFTEGQSVWRSNFLALTDNAQYMLATAITYICDYGCVPGIIAYVAPAPALGTWYSLLLVTSYGVGDFLGKLLPVWKPLRPRTTVMAVAMARLIAFPAVFAMILYFEAGAALTFTAVFALGVSCWYVTMIFSLACEGQHHEDAYQVESLLAIQLEVGAVMGSAMSLMWSLGPWASGAAAAATHT
eukprot:gene5029-5271_t